MPPDPAEHPASGLNNLPPLLPTLCKKNTKHMEPLLTYTHALTHTDAHALLTRVRHAITHLPARRNGGNKHTCQRSETRSVLIRRRTAASQPANISLKLRLWSQDSSLSALPPAPPAAVAVVIRRKPGELRETSSAAAAAAAAVRTAERRCAETDR